MSCCIKKEKDHLLLKSLLCVALVSTAALLLLRHAVPVEKENKFFGGSVYLLVAQTPEDSMQFFRWAELNRPSNIFGYNSRGIFSKAVPQSENPILPVVRSAVLPSFLPLPLPIGRGDHLLTPVAVEKGSGAGSDVLPSRTGNDRAPFAFSGVQVFNEKGDVVATLHGVSGTGGVKPLLMRSRQSVSGTEFAVVESSGDRDFDRSVTDALIQRTLRGESFNGIFAVWPDIKGGRR